MITSELDDELWDDIRNYEGSEIEKLFKENSPSDYIVLTPELGMNLFKILNNMGLGDYVCPSDIIVSDTVPLPDIIIKNELSIEDKNSKGTKDYVRFLYKDGELRLLYVCYTAESVYIDSMPVAITADRPEELMIFPQKVWRNVNARRSYAYIKNIKTKEEFNQFLLDVCTERQIFLTMWYAIQVLLLNPDISKSDALKAKGKEKIPAVVSGSPNQNGTKRKRKAKYMKRLYLNEDFFKTRKEFERHTLCWYVIGHKRHYKDGKEVWVKGYWKGPMRHTKKNLDDGRERILANAETK